MQIRWSRRAAENLAAVVAHIRKDSPEGALKTARAIYDRAITLGQFPLLGKAGRVTGTRELPVPPLPFIVVYRVRKDAVEISNILHGAQNWK